MSSMASARRALSLDPLDAEMHRQLVEMHLAAGEADLRGGRLQPLPRSAADAQRSGGVTESLFL